MLFSKKNKIILFATLVFAGCASISPQVNSYQEAKKSNKDEIAILSKLRNKNELISSLLKLATSHYLETNGFGQMRDFSIDTDHKSFAFNIDLKGEIAPLRVVVPKYDVLRESGRVYFVARNVVTDKEWLNQVAKKYLQEKKIEIPPKYSTLVLLVF
jgi:hypothetical protein